MTRLTRDDVACWVLKSSVPPTGMAPDWGAGTERVLTRCVRPSYRLGLMEAGQPCLLWLSGRDRPGVHALGVLAGLPSPTTDGPVVPVRLVLLADPVARDAEVLRMPAGSNPSWLSRPQFDAVLARVPRPDGAPRLEPWSP